jgi:hypothetical protein
MQVYCGGLSNSTANGTPLASACDELVVGLAAMINNRVHPNVVTDPTQVCASVCVCVCVCVCAHLCASVCICARLCAVHCIAVRMYTCVCVCVCVCALRSALLYQYLPPCNHELILT